MCSAVALPGCSSKNNSDDDDDSGSGGESGAANPGDSCDSTHKCGGGLSCVSGVCAPSSSSGGTGGTGSIPPGTLGGSCKSGDTCDSGLRCYTGVCIPESTGSGGGSGATEGTLAGPCYPNDTCNAGLSCFDGYCLPESSVGGSGGGSGTGGATNGGGTQGGSGGTGGSSLGGTGGSGGSGGTGGSKGGSGGSGGTGGGSSGMGGGGGSGGTGGTTEIVATDGVVVAGTNTVGVVGLWYVFVDKDSTITPQPNGIDFTDAGSDICVTATTRQSDEFGPTLAIDLNRPDPAGDPLGYVPAEHGVTGFSFTMSGAALPSVLQITYAGLDGSQYCIFTEDTAGSLPFSATTKDCWNSGGAAGLTTTSYATLQFALPVNYHADGQTFDFCISNLTALTN